VAPTGPSTRPSLLVLTSTFPTSADDGTPPFVLQLCNRLLSRFEVTALTPAVGNAPQSQTLLGVSVQRFHYFWPRSLERLADGAMMENLSRNRWLYLQAPLLFLFGLIAAFRLARSMRPAVIHAHWFVPQGIVAVLVGGLLGIPVVITSHGGDVYGLRGRLWNALRRVLAARCKSVTVVSRDMAANLPDVMTQGRERPKVMPMGVDTQRFAVGSVRHAESDETVLFVGRLARKKGVQYLIRAFTHVSERHPEARLLVVGDGPCRGELETLSSQLGLADRVHFTGARPPAELPGFYGNSRVFVSPSLTEGFGITSVEAMAAGCPVVATSVGGVPDVVVHERTGLLVEPESSIALAAAINELLESTAKAARMATLARRWVKRKFDWQQVAHRYADMLAQAAQSGRAGESQGHAAAAVSKQRV
jgi:glycosyltransferase involved in cell wall biosynthesis